MKKIPILVLVFLISTGIAYAFANCMQKYASHPRALPSQKNNCGICHLNASGSGPRNAFGNAFANNGFKITDDLISQFPELFTQASEDNNDSSEEPAPKIKRIKPNKIKINIPAMAKIKGMNFTDGAKVFIDENEVTTSFQSDMLLLIDFTLTTPGAHLVTIKNPDGQESNTLKIISKE